MAGQGRPLVRSDRYPDATQLAETRKTFEPSAEPGRFGTEASEVQIHWPRPLRNRSWRTSSTTFSSSSIPAPELAMSERCRSLTSIKWDRVLPKQRPPSVVACHADALADTDALG